MVKKRRKKKSGGMGILALLVALAVSAGYFFRDCMPNIGMGGGAGTTSESSEEPSDKPVAEKPAGEKGTALVTVRGEECVLADAAPAPCPQVCESVKGTYAPTTQIQIDDTVGAHAVVEELKKCLGDNGFSDIKFKSE